MFVESLQIEEAKLGRELTEKRVETHSKAKTPLHRRPSIDRHLAFINTFHPTPIILLTRHSVKEETLNCNFDIFSHYYGLLKRSFVSFPAIYFNVIFNVRLITLT